MDPLLTRIRPAGGLLVTGALLASIAVLSAQDLSTGDLRAEPSNAVLPPALQESRGGIRRKDDGKRDDGTTEELSEDQQLVRDSLQDFLHPTKLEFLEDGRVQMLFDFNRKNPDHSYIFTPQVRTKVNSTFRWTVPGEDYYYGYGYGSSSSSSSSSSGSRYYGGGLRISTKGLALLNCWFKNDLEAEIVYAQGTNIQKGHTVAVVYYGKKHDVLGSNFGTQCRIYKRTAPTKNWKGEPQSLVIYRSARFKLVVKDDTFEAHRDGRLRNSLKYTKKRLSSGKVGILWGGNIAGTIVRLSITGRIDDEPTAKLLRGKLKGRRSKSRR